MDKVTIVYDQVGNTLDVWFGKPRKTVCEEAGHGFILKKDSKGNILGFEKLNYVKKNEGVKNLPVEVLMST